MIPGDISAFYAGPHASGQVIQETRHALGLDQPKYIQYFRYLWQLMHANFGQWATLDEPVLTAILSRAPQTAMLAAAVIVLEMVFMLIFGILSSLYEESLIDRLTAVLAVLGVSLPGFWIGLMLLFIVAYKLNLLPLGGYDNPVILYLILPAATQGVPGGFWYARILKASLADVLQEDYIRTARSK